jgi:hypothetical protein
VLYHSKACVHALSSTAAFFAAATVAMAQPGCVHLALCSQSRRLQCCSLCQGPSRAALSAADLQLLGQLARPSWQRERQECRGADECLEITPVCRTNLCCCLRMCLCMMQARYLCNKFIRVVSWQRASLAVAPITAWTSSAGNTQIQKYHAPCPTYACIRDICMH